MNGMLELPPALLLSGTALVLPLLPRWSRAPTTVVMPLLALGWLLGVESGATITAPFAGFDLVLFQLDRLNFVFGIIFLLIASVASIYAWHVRDTGQQVAAMFYGAGALGVTFAGDLLTLLLFWELMAVASAWLVFARRRPESTRAGFRYLLVHLTGGTILLGGILLHYAATGSLLLEPITAQSGVAGWLILLGVAINVALPPFHAWLPDAYPRATVSGAIYLSALTTKSAVYVLVKLFAGWEILIYGGAAMALYGVVYAVLANDIRQILAYHIISQVGYMVAGVGIGTELALNGTVAHAYSHILYKALLFMGAGAVLHATGRSQLTELGGLAPKMRAVLWLFMIGAFSISGFPLFNGFISKSMIVSAAGQAHHETVMLLLLLASVGTFLHTGLKIPVFTFWGNDRNLETRPVPTNMYLAMGLLALACTVYGVAPGLLYRMLPFPVTYHPYTASHLVEAVQLLTLTFVGFWLLRDKLAGEPFIALDTDWFYRRGAAPVTRWIVVPINAAFTRAASLRDALVRFVARGFANPRSWLYPRRGGLKPFDPDRERAPISASLAFTLLVLIAVSALMWWP